MTRTTVMRTAIFSSLLGLNLINFDANVDFENICSTSILSGNRAVKMRRDELHGREPITIGLGLYWRSVGEIGRSLSDDVPEDGGKNVAIGELASSAREIGN